MKKTKTLLVSLGIVGILNSPSLADDYSDKAKKIYSSNMKYSSSLGTLDYSSRDWKHNLLIKGKDYRVISHDGKKLLEVCEISKLGTSCYLDNSLSGVADRAYINYVFLDNIGDNWTSPKCENEVLNPQNLKRSCSDLSTQNYRRILDLLYPKFK